MIQSDLDLARSHAVVRIGQALGLLAGSTEPIMEARGLFELCAQHRTLAIASVLQECDVSAWVFHLCACAQAQLELRERAAGGIDIPAKYLCGSKNIGLSAALVAGDLETAQRLGNLSPQQHDERYEYEDDFLFFHFLRLALDHPDPSDSTLMSTVERWDIVLEGGRSSARDVCHALALSDEGAFSEAFTSLLVTRDERLEEFQQLSTCDPKDYAIESGIFIEGLAVLRLADLRGIHTEPEYRYAPSVTRVPLQERPPHPEAWRRPVD